MITAKLQIPKNISVGIHTIKNMKLILLSFQDRFLNFKENIGISETSNQENRQTNMNKQTGWQFSEINKSWAPATKDPQNSAFAGTGRPINELVCRVSLLNFAKRNAENTEIKKAA